MFVNCFLAAQTVALPEYLSLAARTATLLISFLNTSPYCQLADELANDNDLPGKVRREKTQINIQLPAHRAQTSTSCRLIHPITPPVPTENRFQPINILPNTEHASTRRNK